MPRLSRSSASSSEFVDALSQFIAYASESQRLVRQEILAEKKIGSREFFALNALDRGQPITFRELVNRLDFGINADHMPLPVNEKAKKSTVSQVVNRLEKRGLASKEGKKDTDDRQPLIQRTPAGDEIIERVSAAENEAVGVVLSNGLGLGSEARQKISNLLEAGMIRMLRLHRSGKANQARVYDFLLDGKYFLPVDQAAAHRLLKAWPDYGKAAKENRAFQRRAILFLNQQHAINQFIDIGAGLPAESSTDEVILGSSVLYVDNDPDVVAISKHVLEERHAKNVAYIQGDLSDPDSILWSKEFRKIIDLSKPVGIILGGVLHYILSDALATASLRTFANRLAPGSCFVVSHGASIESEVHEEYQKRVSLSRPRTASEILQLFAGMELIGETKLVYAPLWKPAIGDGKYKPGATPLADRPAAARLLVGIFRNNVPI